ncbi:hypothetical protein EGW08_016471, partial [Elysia chlorotica]
METRNFLKHWRFPVTWKTKDPYIFTPDSFTHFHRIDDLPLSGYKKVVYVENSTFSKDISVIKNSFWIDQHTRFIVVDFSVLNLNSKIASSIHIRFDFHRSAPYWHTNSFHFVYALTGNNYYYIAIVFVSFAVLSTYNGVKQLLLAYKMGPLRYLRYPDSYVEVIKMLLSAINCYAFLKKEALKTELLQELKYSYLIRGSYEFVDFFGMALFDYWFFATGGILAFLCIFQMLYMLSKIRRLTIFMSLTIKTVKLFYMPLLVGVAFTFLSSILFGSTTGQFSSFGLSYLMVNQYYVKPINIYADLTANHPYTGPWFYFVMGMTISIFMFNMFIAFLNEAYSAIQNQ